MIRRASTMAAFIAATAFSAPGFAQPPAQPAPQPALPVGPPPVPPFDARPMTGAEPNMTLLALLEQFRANTGRNFLIHAGAAKDVYVVGINLGELDHPLLLSVLRQNSLTALDVGGRINVIPISEVRSWPVRLVEPTARNVPDDEIVTMVVRLDTASAAPLIPILRPLLPVSAHLAAAADQNVVVIVDRFANARRMVELIETLDR